MNAETLRQRLVPRFHPGHEVWALLAAGDYAGVADAIKAKYSYEHPLEAQVRAMSDVIVTFESGTFETVAYNEVPAEAVEEESTPALPARRRPRGRKGK